MVLGVDVSEANGSVQWSQVREAGYRFAICKVSEGDRHDGSFSGERVRAARKAGLVLGGYVYLRPKAFRTGGQEFNIFIDRARTCGLYVHLDRMEDIRPVLDLEQSDIDAESTVEYVKEAVDQCLRVLKRHPILYVGEYWRDALGDPTRNFGCPLWYPEYGVTRPHLAPRAWPHGPAIWQYSGNGRCPGVNGDVDLNRYFGSSLRQFKRELCV